MSNLPADIDPSYGIEWEELDIISQVGYGAFAEVSEALRGGERVAVKKMLTQSIDEKNMNEFVNEVRLMASFHSSYIVALYGACFKAPNLCMVMEFLPHGSLNHLIYDSSQEISWDKRWNYAKDAAVGMHYLHTRNPPVLHRDLKSGNLLLAEDGRVKITDFGLSRFKQKNPVKDDFQGGTDRWTAPEVIEGEIYTESADVFSYGIILFELAMRVLPFQDLSPEDVRLKWTKGQRPPVNDDDVPVDFDKLIRMCWDQNPYSRPSFKEIVSYLKRKGKINNISTEKSQGRLSDEREKLLRENDILLQLKENLEKKRDEADRIAEREKKKASELEARNDELERRFTEEKNKRLQTERDNTEVTRNLRKEQERVKEIEDARKNAEKKVKSAVKKAGEETREEQARLLEDSERRIAEERVRYNKLKTQLEELEAKVQEEELRRIEVEKKLLGFQKEIDEEKKKREAAERDRDAAEKKAKTEKRKAETEKKRREDLENEIEEENKRRAAARRRNP